MDPRYSKIIYIRTSLWYLVITTSHTQSLCVFEFLRCVRSRILYNSNLNNSYRVHILLVKRQTRTQHIKWTPGTDNIIPNSENPFRPSACGILSCEILVPGTRVLCVWPYDNDCVFALSFYRVYTQLWQNTIEFWTSIQHT